MQFVPLMDKVTANIMNQAVLSLLLNVFVSVSNRRCCSLTGWRSFLSTTTSTWAETQTPTLSDRSTCTGSSDLDWTRLSLISVEIVLAN